MGKEGFFVDGDQQFKCEIVRRARVHTRILLEDGSEKVVPSTFVVPSVSNTPSERILPLIPLELFYRPLRDLTGDRESKYQAILSLLCDRNGPKDAEFVEELFRRSVRHAESYGNVDEAFYESRVDSQKVESKFARNLVTKMNESRTINAGDYIITFADYEIYPFRTTLSCHENGKNASHAGSGGMDILLASSVNNEVLPAIGEIKAASEHVGPTFALIQALMYAAQMVTKNQFLRLKKHYPDIFGQLNIEKPRIDIIVFLESQENSENEDLKYALSLAQKICLNSSDYLRQILFVHTSIEDDIVTCKVAKSN